EMRRVVIGRSTLEAQIPWESLVGLESRSFIGQSINTSAPPIFGFHLESLIKAPRYAQVQGVVIRIYVRCGEEHLEKVRVQSVINEVQIYDAHQLARIASFISQPHDHLVGQLRFRFERVIVRVRSREIPGGAPGFHLPGDRETCGRINALRQGGICRITVNRIACALHKCNFAAVEWRTEVCRSRTAAQAETREERWIAASIGK